MSPYPNALILAHPNMSAAAAIELCRETGMRLVHTKNGNYRIESSPEPAFKRGPSLPRAGSVVGPLEAA